MANPITRTAKRIAVATGLIDSPEAQLATAREKLEVAQAAHREISGRADELRAKFVESGDVEAKKALRSVRDELDDSSLDVERAQELVRRAEAAVDDANRRDLQRRRAELEAELTRERIEAAAAPLAERESDLLIQLVECRAERANLRKALAAKVSELENVIRGLNEPVGRIEIENEDGHGVTAHTVPMDFTFIADSHSAVDQVLFARIDELPASDPRRALLQELVRGERAYVSPSFDVYRVERPSKLVDGDSPEAYPHGDSRRKLTMPSPSARFTPLNGVAS